MVGSSLLIALTVKNFTLVEHLEVDFSLGMTALTGETGAGKSLVIDALAMALGDRADTDRIRRGAERAEVSAMFDLKTAPRATQWLQNNDFDNNSKECLLRRLLTSEGRSRGYINGQSATMQQLRDLGEMLIDIHSQHEHQSLLRKYAHRHILDDFSGCATMATETKKLYQQWASIKEQLQQLENSSDELTAQRDLLRFQVEELNQLGLSDGEYTTLEQEQQLLANADAILHDSHVLLQLCSEAETFNLQSALSKALHVLQAMPNKPVPLEEAEKLLGSALIEVEEADREIQRHLDSFELDPERLQQVEERLSAIYQLARKHRVSPEALEQKHAELNQALNAINGDEDEISALQHQLELMAANYSTLANALTAKRTSAAKQLASAIEEQFSSLSMIGAKFSIKLAPLPDHSFGTHGKETVEFLISTNPGEPVKPLAKIASGGELSRISLAIQVIAAQNSSIPTMIFDEVDVGIGGATAEVVGKLLRTLGDRGQVICVTHQPQVAASAHHHLLVSKMTKQHTTQSHIKPLSETGRTNEIARMLGGSTVTDTTLSHAKELLGLASQPL
jgi:DNA repair protein RecN (Recombination protein N)